jgi:Ca-activated chloride channel homolog
MNHRRLLSAIAGIALSTVSSIQSAQAAGILTPVNSNSTPPVLVDHSVKVVINNGFARTEVTQRFMNPGSSAVDAIYEFPVPKDAALADMTIQVGEQTMHGEVLPRDKAATIYAEQDDAGAQAGLATQNSYQSFQFSISNIPAGGEADMTFVYYEPLLIDTAVGRYLYPLQDGGTNADSATSFWTRTEKITGTFKFDLELKSATPVEELRVPDLSPQITKLADGHYTVHLDSNQATLNQDVVVYYRLPDDQPGSVQVIPYRTNAEGAGTFMMVVTPGIDLAPITTGHDIVFVMDVSGSMDTKIATLTNAVTQSIQQLTSQDRFRVVAFSTTAWDVTGGYLAATSENIAATNAKLAKLTSMDSTNLYDGMQLALTNIDQDRVTEVLLVTDGVTNTGIVDPSSFVTLLKSSDVRTFGFLLGNSANWPLMDLITDVSGGFYAQVSNQDDIFGQVMLANSKITHESMHDSRLSISGVSVHDTTDFDFGKVYRGQQLVVFGRYDQAGTAHMNLATKITGQPHNYGLDFGFPASDTANPELERLWALDMIHAIQRQRMLGLISDTEASAAIQKLGLDYQLVTEETSMLVLDDATFEQLGVDLNNEQRTSVEQQAQAANASQPATNYAVGTPTDTGSGSSYSSSSSSSGAGALDPFSIGAGLLAAMALLASRRRSSLDATH